MILGNKTLLSIYQNKKKYIIKIDAIKKNSQFSGDGKDEEVAAKTMNYPFWRINAHSDLIAFYNALDMGFM